MKDRYNKQILQQKSDAQALADMTEKKHQKQIDRYRSEIRKVYQKLVLVEQQWASRLSKLDSELSTANDV